MSLEKYSTYGTVHHLIARMWHKRVERTCGQAQQQTDVPQQPHELIDSKTDLAC